MGYYSWVLSAWQVYSRPCTTCQWLLASIKCTTGFTCKYLSLVSYYLRVKNCMTGVICEYFQLVSNRSQAVYFPCCMSLTHELSSNFLEAWSITCVFCKLGCELYCMYAPNPMHYSQNCSQGFCQSRNSWNDTFFIAILGTV